MSRRPDQHTSPRGRRHPLRPDLDMALLASKLGCSAGHLSDILSGRRRVTPKMAPKLAQALNLPLVRVADTIASWAAQAAFVNRRVR